MFVFGLDAWAMSPAIGLSSVSLFFACFLCLFVSVLPLLIKKRIDAGLGLDRVYHQQRHNIIWEWEGWAEEGKNLIK